MTIRPSLPAALRLLAGVTAVVVLGAAPGCHGSADGADLFSRYYRPYDLKLDPVALQSEPALIPAYEAYRKQDYRTVARVTGDFTRNEVRLPLVMLIQSIALIEIDSADRAIATLTVVEAHPAYGTQSSWYKGLALLREGRYADARETLRSIGEDKDPEMAQRAATLLEEMKDL